MKEQNFIKLKVTYKESMEKVKFYRGDPLAYFLIDILNLTPIIFSLIPAIVGLGYGLVLAWLSGSISSQPGQIGFLQDTAGWVWRLFVGPVAAGYYLWSSRAFEALVDNLRRSEVIDISNNEIAVVLKTYQKSWRLYLSLGVAIIIGIAYYLSRSQVQNWTNSSMAARLVSAIVFTGGGYIIGMIASTLVLNVWSLRKILSDKEFNINPLHPDRCGGLKMLGDYSLKTVYLAAVAGLMIGLTEYRFITQGAAPYYWLLHLSIPVYIVVVSISFYAPLNLAHKKMKEVRDQSLRKIAEQFQDDYSRTQSELTEDAKILENEISKMQRLQELYDLTARFPVWPFDVTTFRLFLASMTAPIIPPVIGMFIDILSSRLIPPN